MIRKYQKGDRAIAFELMKSFYNSEAVLHSVPQQFFQRTLDQLDCDSPFVSLYIIEDEQNNICGYGLLSHTYSNEAGGKTVWLEELYVVPQARGKQLGKQFLDFLINNYRDCARIRLEVEPANANAMRLYVNKGFVQLPYVQYVKDN